MKGLIAIYALTAVGVLGSIYSPLVALMVYVLFASLRPQSLWGFAGNFTGISQAVGIALLASWAIRGLGGFRLGKASLSVFSLVFFAVWVVLSSLQGVDPASGYIWWIELLKVLLPLIAGITLLTTLPLVRALLWIIVFSHGYVGYEMNLSYYVGGFNYIAEAGFGGMDNNSFALSLVTAVGPAVALGLSAKRWWEKALAGVCCVLILHTIILSYSRGAMVGLIATVVGAFLIFPKGPKTLGATVLVVLLTARLTGPEVMARFETTFAEAEERDGSAQSRVDLWNACWRIGTENPMFGIGPRGFPVVAHNYGFSRRKEAHSTWMQTLAETGFPGVLSLAFFYLFAAVRLWPMARQSWSGENGEQAALAAGVLASLVGFITCAQFVSMIGLETPYYVTMAGLALLNLNRQGAVAVVPVPTQPVVSDAPIMASTWRPRQSATSRSSFHERAPQ